MWSRLRYTAVAIGIVALFLIATFQFVEEYSWSSWNLPLSGKVIVLDAGHGGPDGGASAEGILEKDIALSITKMVRDYLQEQGALVIMTREKDKDLAGDIAGYRARKREDLKKRVEIINDSQADLYLSIHLNAFPSSKYSGAQTFYTMRYKENKEVAKFIQYELTHNLNNTTREAKSIDHVYVMKYAKKPGALVEVGFLSNANERAQLTKSSYQNKVSASIYKGIMRYFTEGTMKDDEDGE
ncbi:N-acetylmuramoyl-L-alanine amidase CwlD [Bacillus massiliigorillae]|uniref:N-acetylmuramoyl-L-alanine amidase CwlD n=1 Tax=Bacillus massiliigorillae TaxID=1243664 RepID=UPI00039EBC5F|nr:N-acetylmuramoyl-L-alanine amidase CwlD [Bacillus massiliigorillae]